MRIPKVIHYCWFGKAPLPESAEKCIASWRKYCPDYQIIQWNEDNFNFSECTYAAEAYKIKKWSFVSDYARYAVIYEHGGIYLDTDVELIKNIDALLDNAAYMGFEDCDTVATGLGFGAEKGNAIVLALLRDYYTLPLYDESGNINPIIQPKLTTALLVKKGLKLNCKKPQNIEGVTVYPVEYFCPKDFKTEKTRIGKNTYSIHHYTASWYSDEQRKVHAFSVRKRTMEKRFGKKGYRAILTLRYLFIEKGLVRIVRKKLNNILRKA